MHYSWQPLLMISRYLHQRGTPRCSNNSNYLSHTILKKCCFSINKELTSKRTRTEREKRREQKYVHASHIPIQMQERTAEETRRQGRYSSSASGDSVINNGGQKKKWKEVIDSPPLTIKRVIVMKFSALNAPTHFWTNFTAIGHFKACKLIVRPAATPHTTNDTSWIPKGDKVISLFAKSWKGKNLPIPKESVTKPIFIGL